MAQQSILIVRRPGTVAFLASKPDGTVGDVIKSYEAGSFQTSTDGQLIALVGQSIVTVIAGSTFQQVARFSVEGVTTVEFSGSSKYVVTVQKPGGGDDRNLKVWELKSGQVVAQMNHRSKGSGPALHFVADDTLACHLVTNTIHVYDTTQWSAEGTATGLVHRLMIKSVASFAANPVSRCVAVYVPESKGAPGHVGIYSYAAAGSEPAVPPTVARRAFYRASSVRFNWNKTGTAVLAMAVSDVDVTNQSYYGEQKLHFLTADGSEECTVPLPKDGPIHDVQWSPSGQHFVAVAGFMPAKITLFSSRCKALADVGSGPYNMVRWNAFSHFFAVAGFGNLPGDVAFFEKQKDGKCKELGKTRAENGVSCCWSPDGRNFLTATLAPRLRVDNGFVIHRYNGTLLGSPQKYDVLLEATWKAVPEGTFTERPPSPPARQATSTSAGAPTATGAAAAAAPAVPSSYVPPALRGKARPGASAVPPGASAAAAGGSKSASKNAKKRANRKKPSEDDAVEAVTQGVAEVSTSGSAGGLATGGTNGSSAEAEAGGAADTEKRIRNLRKKLNQITQLKERRDKEGAAALDPDQLKKINTEASIIEEMKSLGASV